MGMKMKFRPLFWPTVFSLPALLVLIGLGTWQGIFLIELRAKAHQRQIALHISGE